MLAQPINIVRNLEIQQQQMPSLWPALQTLQRLLLQLRQPQPQLKSRYFERIHKGYFCGVVI